MADSLDGEERVLSQRDWMRVLVEERMLVKDRAILGNTSQPCLYQG